MNIWDEIKSTFKNGSVITRLIYVNLAVFLFIRALYVFFYLFKTEYDFIQWLALPSDISVLASRPWTLFTYMFLHFDFLHILFNLLWLYWFGKIFLMYFDEKKLFGTYLFGGLTGGILYLLAYNFFPAFSSEAVNSLLLGASASIIAIVVAAAIYVPNLKLNLLLISSIFGPIKIIWIALISLFIYFLGITGSNAGGNIAHLGGALWGFIYMVQLKRGFDILKGFNRLLALITPIFKKRSKLRIKYNKNQTRNLTDWEYNKKRKNEDEQINQILDKIAQKGYDSLTRSEKELLFQMGKNKGKYN
jgi:membrane associated rhomboid family serine protease